MNEHAERKQSAAEEILGVAVYVVENSADYNSTLLRIEKVLSESEKILRAKLAAVTQERNELQKQVKAMQIDSNDVNALHRLMNYIQIEGDVGDYINSRGSIAISKDFKRIIRTARKSLHRIA